MPAFIRQPHPIDSDRDYVVAVTRLSVRSPRTALAFLRRLAGVTRQMRRTDGLACFGLRAQLFRLTFSTYGVFESRRALTGFLSTGAHGEAMVALGGRLHHVEACTVGLAGADLPHGWDAIQALLEPGRSPLIPAPIVEPAL